MGTCDTHHRVLNILSCVYNLIAKDEFKCSTQFTMITACHGQQAETMLFSTVGETFWEFKQVTWLFFPVIT